jgi:hypothetical protein
MTGEPSRELPVNLPRLMSFIPVVLMSVHQPDAPIQSLTLKRTLVAGLGLRCQRGVIRNRAFCATEPAVRLLSALFTLGNFLGHDPFLWWGCHRR